MRSFQQSQNILNCRKRIGGIILNLRDLFAEAMKKDKDTQEKFLEIFEHCVGKDVMDNSWWDLYTFLYEY